MKPLVEYPRSKKFQRYLKAMPNGPPTDKWNMPEDANLKKFIESSSSKSSWKSNKESEQGEYVFSGCKTSNVLIISRV